MIIQKTIFFYLKFKQINNSSTTIYNTNKNYNIWLKLTKKLLKNYNIIAIFTEEYKKIFRGSNNKNSIDSKNNDEKKGIGLKDNIKEGKDINLDNNIEKDKLDNNNINIYWGQFNKILKTLKTLKINIPN